MTPTPPSGSSSRASENSPDAFRVVRKRNRIPLSCAPCRHRKLKCNRQSPCDNCIKRGDSPSCAYAAPATRKKGSSANTANASPDDMQNRIDRLEGLVLSLMTNGSGSQGPAAAAQALSAHESSNGSVGGHNFDTSLDESQMLDAQSERDEEQSETDGVTKSFGVLKVDADQQKTIYIGETHWSALLSEIGEVKTYFQQHKKEYEAQREKVEQARQAVGGSDIGAGPALLFGASIPPSRNEILGQLPSRYTCDILVGRYFNTYDPSTHVLHGPAFQRQYNAHWADSSKTSIVWIGMLFSMLRLAMISYGREGDEPPEFRGKCHDMASTYRTQMAHCLITADYTKPHDFIIETLIFHLHAEYTSNRDAEASVWVLVGMIARLAMRMGYHRDTKNFPYISVFRGEMRRRIWTFVRTADLLFSFQVALPPMIRIGDSDTELPRNIYDDEFDEDSKELPPSRPASEATPISYLIAKGRLSFGFGRVLEEVSAINKHGYEEILKIDKGLQDMYQDVPEHLQLRPMSEQQLAPMTLIMARFSLATVYHKSLCVLHRRFLMQAKRNNKYMHSRRKCIDSAMQLLSYQAIQQQQSQERGRMRSLRNHVNSLTTHDFLLAASVLCMDLYAHREQSGSDISTPNTSISGSTSQRSGSISGTSDGAYVPGLSYTREDLVKALEASRDIWYANRDYSMEAYKASELLNVLLYHLRLPFSPSQPNAQIPMMSSASMNGVPGNSNDERTAAMTLGMLQSGGVVPNNTQSTPATQLAQQAQQPDPVWDGNKVGNPMMNAFLSGNQNGGFANQGPLSPGVFGSGNTTSNIFPDALLNGTGGVDIHMNFDWETWDQYMQPGNLSLDPAANLWSTNSPNANNLFGQTPSSDSNASGNPSMPTGSDVSYNVNSNFFSQNQDLVKDNGNTTNGGTTDSDPAGTANDAFMGASTPGPGGVGMGGWKWTVMSGENGRS